MTLRDLVMTVRLVQRVIVHCHACLLGALPTPTSASAFLPISISHVSLAKLAEMSTSFKLVL